jgi:hypothetical protein
MQQRAPLAKEKAKRCNANRLKYDGIAMTRLPRERALVKPGLVS